jgi:uncharacterized membrane protein YdjX (TVP38/TMEM64 family)
MRTSTPQPTSAGPTLKRARTALARALPMLCLVAATGAFWLSGANRLLNLESVLENRESLVAHVDRHQLVAAIVFIAAYAAAVAVSFPGAALLTIMGGFLFGAWLGGSLAVIGATLGAAVIFFVARSTLGNGLARRAGPFLGRFASGFEEDAFFYLLSLRLAPLFPFWLVNLAPALVGIRLRDHLGATFLGIIPGTFAFAAIGQGLDSVMEAQHRSVEACEAAVRGGCSTTLDPYSLLTPGAMAALGVLAALSLLPIAIRIMRRARDGAGRGGAEVRWRRR